MSEIDCNCCLECSAFMELGKNLDRKGRYFIFLFDYFEPKVRNLRERLLPSRSVELHM